MCDFTEEKMHLLKDANEKMLICDDLSEEKNKNLLFVYCPPKVGSTSLVTSFRLCALGKFTVLHIHDELMLKVLCGIENVTVNEIILYNKSLGKNVYVIDIYRTPIEQKISAFFEKISSFHFNNTDENVNNYDVNKVIKRFNKIFPYLSRFDYYRDVYNIPFPKNFDFKKKYAIVESNGIKFIKLRLKDSNEWQQILKEIFGIDVRIVNDYETDKKGIKNMFSQFKLCYRIPANFLEDVENCDSLKYYYSPQEREFYLNSWRIKRNGNFESYTESEYALYLDISLDNQHIGEIQRNHYMDSGCACTSCYRKRNQILYRISRGDEVQDVVDHEQATNEFKRLIVERKKAKLNALASQVAIVNALNNMKKTRNPKNILKVAFKNHVN
jgi:hypothetical protein